MSGKQKAMRTASANRLEKVTFEQFEEAMARYAQAEHREVEINAAVEDEIAELMLQYKDELGALAQGKAMAFNTVESYCRDNKQALFTKRRSIGTIYGVAGFRLGKPRLKTLPGKDWKEVLDELKIKLPSYIRSNDEPAKDLLLADRYKEEIAPLLAEIGIEVIQDELFYIETKKAA